MLVLFLVFIRFTTFWFAKFTYRWKRVLWSTRMVGKLTSSWKNTVTSGTGSIIRRISLNQEIHQYILIRLKVSYGFISDFLPFFWYTYIQYVANPLKLCLLTLYPPNFKNINGTPCEVSCQVLFFVRAICVRSLIVIYLMR